MKRSHLAIFFFLLFSISSFSVSTAEAATATADYIIEVDLPKGFTLESFSLKILAAILGSVEAAKKALIYEYEFTLNGFAASLTKEQASKIRHQPHVLAVLLDKHYLLAPIYPVRR